MKIERNVFQDGGLKEKVLLVNPVSLISGSYSTTFTYDNTKQMMSGVKINDR